MQVLFIPECEHSFPMLSDFQDCIYNKVNNLNYYFVSINPFFFTQHWWVIISRGEGEGDEEVIKGSSEQTL